MRNCKDCVIYVCCKQLRTRDCENCTIYLYCKTEPIIEKSSGMKFGCFIGGYPEQEQHFKDAQLDPSVNKWSQIFDFNDEAKTGENWSILSDADYADPWFPLAPVDPPFIPRSDGGACTATVQESGGMQSFSFNTSQAEAEAAVLAAEGAAPPVPPTDVPTESTPAAPELASPEVAQGRRVLMVATSAHSYGGMDTGMWLEELAQPYYMFLTAGWQVTIASPAGGPIPIDSGSMRGDFFTIPAKQFMLDPDAIHALTHSKKLENLAPNFSESFDVVFLVGGHGCCSDFVDNPALRSCLESMYNAEGKVISTVCHGAIALPQCSKSDGTPLINGLKCTAFSDSEETAVGLAEKVPFLIETKMKEQGALYERSADWNGHAVVDGCVITGQNPQSSGLVAQAILAACT